MVHSRLGKRQEQRHEAAGTVCAHAHTGTCECASWYRRHDKESGLTGDDSLLAGRTESNPKKP